MLGKIMENEGMEREEGQMKIILKELRDISCSHLAPALFANPSNLRLLVSIQNNHRLETLTQISTHEILLNITGGDSDYQTHYLNILTLSIAPYLQSNKTIIIDLIFQICYNMLLSDTSSATFYQIATKCHIFKHLIEFILNKRHNYEQIKAHFLLLAFRLVSTACRYGFTSKVDNLYVTFVILYYQEVRKMIVGSADELVRSDVSRNELLRYLRSVLRVEEEGIDLDDELIETLVSSEYFDLTNGYYLVTMCTLSYRSLFCFSNTQLNLILLELLDHPSSDLAPTLLRIVANCLINDSSCWMLVHKRFL